MPDDNEKLNLQLAQCVLVLLLQTFLNRQTHCETELIYNRSRSMPFE
jgi:hypothetical protein